MSLFAGKIRCHSERSLPCTPPPNTLVPAVDAPEAWAYVAVDNISATESFGGRGRSSTAWIQSLRRQLRPLLRQAVEIYVPSQHVTGAEGLIPALQARCDELAAEAHARAAPLSIPCPEFLQHETLLYLGGALVVDVGLALEGAYRDLVLPPAGGCPPVPYWPAVLDHAGCNNESIRWYILLQTAQRTPDMLPHCATCPLCNFLIPNWGWHVLYECILLGELWTRPL